MVKAFTFGKYLPFHKGHEALIRFALNTCDKLTVLICCSDLETIPAEVRSNWIQRSFPDEPKLEVRVFCYREADFPNTSVSSKAISGIWSEIFRDFFPDYNIVVTSEKYGDYVAEWLNIKHIPFDIPRKKVPVSATKIRENRLANWEYLPAAVKPDFVFKVAILGTESTGKTWLSRQLSEHYQAALVTEAGRALIPDSSVFSAEDLYRVAEVHASEIVQASSGDFPIIIMDTDIHITESYARFSLDCELSLAPELYVINRADLYLYLDKDATYVQDGTRLPEADRNKLDICHRETLRRRGIRYTEINGAFEARFEQAVREIDARILKHSWNNRIENEDVP